jgi:ABC-2 type transport system permease protein
MKQAKDIFKNPMMLVQFLIYPVVALVMTLLVAKPNPGIPNNMFVSMMGAIFAGMALTVSISAIIAEDVQQKSLRLLVMAGVKPHEYLLGTGGFILLVGVIISCVFGLTGDFTRAELAKFLAVMIGGAAASVLLGASIGILARNQQTAGAIATPLAMILGFTPMIANFNETAEKAASILYTQQLNVIVNDFSASFTKALTVIGANILALLALFVFAYKKKGLKG